MMTECSWDIESLPDDTFHPDEVQDVEGHQADVEGQDVPWEVFSGMRHGLLIVICHTANMQISQLRG